MLLALVYLRLTLTRRLRKQLEPKGEYWKSGTLDFGFFNTIIFAWHVPCPTCHDRKITDSFITILMLSPRLILSKEW